MEIIPAIDLRGGKCVRLVQGDFARETVFGDDPVEMALRWQGEGATWLHVVDLDGARDGAAAQFDIVRRIVEAVTMQVEVGGGIRDAATARRYLDAGVGRCVVGTAAVRSPELVRSLAAWAPDALVVGIDARDGLVATSGWLETGELRAEDLGARMVDAGVRRFVFTDIGRDGTLVGPNLEALRAFTAAVDAAVIASGGVGSLDDLTALAKTGVEGAIVGKALYAGTVSLRAAIEAVTC